MSSRIGADIPGLENTAGVMDETGGRATETGSEASTVSAQMEAEVTDVTTVLTNHFNDLHANLNDALQRARQQLESTDWDGNAMVEAQRAETDLNTQTSTFMDNAAQGVDTFRTQLMQQATDFVGVIQGEYNTVMNNINSAYVDFGGAQRTHADNLVNVDQSFTYRG